MFHDDLYLKDLTLVDKDLRRVVLVDNTYSSFILCPSNGIPVVTFVDDEKDRYLEDVFKVLSSLENEKDVRNLLDQKYMLKVKLAPLISGYNAKQENGVKKITARNKRKGF